jgi:hypothetical protein
MTLETSFKASVPRPRSAMRQWINWFGVATAVLAVAAGLRTQLQLPLLFPLMLAAYAVPIILLEFFTERRPRLTSFSDGWLARTLTRTLAYYAIFAAMLLLVWALPWYQTNFIDGLFATIDWRFAIAAGLLLVFLTPFYLMLVDFNPVEHNQVPDGALALGDWLSGRQDDALKGASIRQFLLGWLVKFFFIPVMLNLSWVSLEEFSTWDWPSGGIASLTAVDAFTFIHETALYLIGFLDVSIALVGYLCTLRLFDSHIRSTDSSAFGWIVCLACYPPLWPVIYESYLAYGDDSYWQDWLANTPAFVQWAWGGTILFFSVIYVWATLSFGIRFSNLTHRGILTNGPYGFVKHPAYIAKNIVFWMSAVPFVSVDGFAEASRLCLLLLGVNALYYLRAKTEERHLRRDTVYVAYEAWIAQNGLWAKAKRLLARVR